MNSHLNTHNLININNIVVPIVAVLQSRTHNQSDRLRHRRLRRAVSLQMWLQHRRISKATQAFSITSWQYCHLQNAGRPQQDAGRQARNWTARCYSVGGFSHGRVHVRLLSCSNNNADGIRCRFKGRRNYGCICATALRADKMSPSLLPPLYVSSVIWWRSRGH